MYVAFVIFNCAIRHREYNHARGNKVNECETILIIDFVFVVLGVNLYMIVGLSISFALFDLFLMHQKCKSYRIQVCCF